MQVMQTFVGWFLSNLPAFFMAEPICYIWGLILLSFVLRMIMDLRRY